MCIDPNAQAVWSKLDSQQKLRILNNVYWVTCKNTAGIGDTNVSLCKHGIELMGVCTICGGPVTRVIEIN